MSEPFCSVYTATSVEEFLDYLLPSADHWKSAKRGDLAYRGQASSLWPLVPKAFRPGEINAYAPSSKPVGAPVRVFPQAISELRAVQQFVKAADASGLRISGAGGRLLSEDSPRQIFHDDNWQYRWPQEEFLETLALAQHHGIPTRLLDFTEDPMTAAFFAARSAWKVASGKRPHGEAKSLLTVWVIDLRFIQALNRIVGRYPERIGEVRVPRGNNSYLNAQFGFFLIDRGANDVMSKGMSLSIEQAIVERAEFWHNGNRLYAKRIARTWFDEVPISQVNLSTNLSAALLRDLDDRGYTLATLMPSLDHVVESLALQRSIQSDGRR